MQVTQNYTSLQNLQIVSTIIAVRVVCGPLTHSYQLTLLLMTTNYNDHKYIIMMHRSSFNINHKMGLSVELKIRCNSTLNFNHCHDRRKLHIACITIQLDHIRNMSAKWKRKDLCASRVANSPAFLFISFPLE